MMKFTLMAVIALTISTCTVSAQESNDFSPKSQSPARPYSQQVYFSIWGPTAFAGINYDVRFTGREDGIGARAGFGIIPQYTEYRRNINGEKQRTEYRPTIVSIPFGLNYVLGKKKHHVEVGAGATYLSGDSLWYDDVTTSYTWLGWWSVNYRLNLRNRISMRAGISGFISTSNNLAARLPVPEWSIGYRF
ncbi:hypothetical protein DVR12_11905 [Chitinophaga silvatica]|uniref:Uncharacterized protein n=1 Tax=Chitinophaga silvatica TaxID=2282649 RepID=A0A3E1Y9X1_9BACT|nr:outer membrane beta-barrel protein [Chitinophaga silvatica]RFS22500.1 hypothetical protein DVR12_11905 [Chitinophaga silvatica]